MLDAAKVPPLECGQALDDELDWLCLLSSTSPGPTQVDLCLSGLPQIPPDSTALSAGPTAALLPAPAARALGWGAQQSYHGLKVAAGAVPVPAGGSSCSGLSHTTPQPAAVEAVLHASYGQLASGPVGPVPPLVPATQQEQLLLPTWQQHPLQTQITMPDQQHWRQQQQQQQQVHLGPPHTTAAAAAAAAGDVAALQVPIPAAAAAPAAAVQLPGQRALSHDLLPSISSRCMEGPCSHALAVTATPYTPQQPQLGQEWHQQQQEEEEEDCQQQQQQLQGRRHQQQQQQQGPAAGYHSGPRGRGRPPRQPGQDVSTMTGAQRYHYRRKADLARMEQEVAEKLLQLQLLQQQNQQLRWRAHVLENMVSDVDKQLESMAAADTTSSDQWLTLLLLGRSSQQLAKPLMELLERGKALDVSKVTLQECVQRWRAYVAECRRLLALVDAAVAAPGAAAAAQQANCQQLQELPGPPAAAEEKGKEELPVAQQPGNSSRQQPAAAGGPASQEPPHQQQQQQQQDATASGCSKPKRAAAAAAVKRIFQFTQRQPLDAAPAGDQVEPGASRKGKVAPGPVGTGAGPDLATATAVMAAAAEEPPSTFQARGVVNNRVVYGGPGSEGVPLDLLSAVEEQVLDNIAWLLALATSNNLVRFQFFACDFEGGGRLPPPDSDPMWDGVLAAVQLTPLQVHECALCLQMAGQLRDRVLRERSQLQQVLDQAPAVISTTQGHGSSSSGSGGASRGATPASGGSGGTGVITGVSVTKELDRMDGQMAAVQAMQKNFKQEELIKHMPGFYCSNNLSLLQQARYAVACWPWCASPWALFEAARRHLEASAKVTATSAQQKLPRQASSDRRHAV